jgi:hypothetical protein
MALSGYSGTVLAQKLSLKNGMRTWWDEMPGSVRAEIERSGLALTHLLWPEPPIDAAHIFVSDRADMEADLRRILPHLAPAGFIWVSWPKRASRLPTDITEDVIREVALPMGLVDIKVCAVDGTWSGLKLVIRKELRGEGPGVHGMPPA